MEGFDADGSYGFWDFLNSLDFNDNTNPPTPITLNQGLDDINEYDLIFLNFANGTDYIQRNAYLLEQVIEIVNSRKTTWNGTRQDNVIIGMSMGGLVARYALRDMELNSEDHETRLFISHDVPHWGANIPVGLQAAVQHLGPWQIVNVGGQFPWISWGDMFPTIADALDMFNSPAAKQMLIQRYVLSGQTLTADNSVHNSFLNELNAMGWPVNCRNLTLSNGSCNGTKQFSDNSTIFTLNGDRSMTYFGSLWRSLIMTLAGSSTIPTFATGGNPQFNHWALLWQFPLSLFATSSSIGLDFKVKAVPASGTQEIYRGDIYSKKKILWVINVKNYFIKCHVNSNTGMLPLDNAPGGVYDVNEFGIDPNVISSQMPSFFNGYITSSVLQPRFCFIPTVSSLALTNPSNNLTSDICANISCLIQAGVQHHFAPQQNELHISYTQANSDWVLTQQNPAVNCIEICAANLSISGPSFVCTTSDPYTIPGIPAGASVTWQVSPAYATPNTTPALQTTLTRQGSSNGNAVLTATITNPCGGSNIVLTKNIIVGTGNPVTGTYNSPTDPVEPMLTTPPRVLPEYENEACIAFVTNITFPAGATVSWYCGSCPVGVIWYQIGNNAFVNFSALDQVVDLSVTVTTACGSKSTGYRFRNVTMASCGIEPLSEPVEELKTATGISLSPNPAHTSLTVQLTGDAAVTNGSGTREIQLTDKTGRVIRRYNYAAAGKQITLDVSALRPDVYYIRVFDGKQWQGKAFIKK